MAIHMISTNSYDSPKIGFLVFCELGAKKDRRDYEKAPKRQLTVKPEGVTVG